MYEFERFVQVVAYSEAVFASALFLGTVMQGVLNTQSYLVPSD